MPVPFENTADSLLFDNYQVITHRPYTHLKFFHKGKLVGEHVMDPDDTYKLGNALMRSYDKLEGLDNDRRGRNNSS